MNVYLIFKHLCHDYFVQSDFTDGLHIQRWTDGCTDMTKALFLEK